MHGYNEGMSKECVVVVRQQMIGEVAGKELHDRENVGHMTVM